MDSKENEAINTAQWIKDTKNCILNAQTALGLPLCAISHLDNHLIASIKIDDATVRIQIPDSQTITEAQFLDMVQLEKSYIEAKKERFSALFDEVKRYVERHDDLDMQLRRVDERLAMTLERKNSHNGFDFKIKTIVEKDDIAQTSGIAAALNVLKHNFPVI